MTAYRPDPAILTLAAPDGGGAPFVLVADVNRVIYEQMLVNSLGAVELWALSTTPEDVAQLVHAHPTQNESLGEAHLALAGKPLHG